MNDMDVIFVYEGERDRRATNIWKHFGELPNSFKTGRERPVSNFEIVEKDGVGGMLFSRHEPNEDSSIVPEAPHIQLEVEEKQFDVGDSSEREVQIKNFLDVIREVYNATDDRPQAVYAFPDPLIEVILNLDQLPATVETLRDGRINYVGWITVFPPNLVETYGRDTLLSAPAWKTEEWDDGSIAVVAFEDPVFLGDPKPVNEHLGLETSVR